jgi:hypothetical protein
MSGLLYLTNEDFFLQKNDNNSIMLSHGIPGFCLVLFYSTKCEFCPALVSTFKKLPGTVNGCQFGILNVSTSRTCVEMSQKSISPIKYVPFIVLYIDGNPYMIYKGSNDGKSLISFILDVAGKVRNKQQFSKDTVKKDSESDIPAYCIGHPVSGFDNRCYLDFLTAYKADKKESKSNN